MIKISLFALVALFVLVAATAAVINAQSSCTTNTVCDNAQAGTSNQGRCPISWLLSAFKTDPNGVADIYTQCHDDGNTCCADPCGNMPTAERCLSLPESANSPSPLCIFMPYSETEYHCISKYKLCALNSFATCQKLPLCEFSNTSNTCGLKLQYSAAEQQDFSLAQCPALHGAVVAFLVLMFISLVGAIIFVIIVVIVKQRKADEEEKKAAEEAAAAEAAAKAQQEEQADF